MSAADAKVSKDDESTPADNKETSKSGPLDFLLNHDTLKPLHKLLSSGSFCDPFQPSGEQSREDAISSVYDLTVQERALIFENKTAIETASTGVEVSYTEDASESTSSSPRAQTDKTREWRSIFPAESKDGTEEAVQQPTENAVSISQPEHEGESSPSIFPSESSKDASEEAIEQTTENALSISQAQGEDSPLRPRANSVSSEGEEIKLAEAHTPKGAPRSPKEFDSAIVETTGDESKAFSPRSPTWKIIKFFILWGIAFFAALFLHPDTGYDMDWLVLKLKEIDDSLKIQAKECESFMAGNVSTRCVVEQIRMVVKDEVVRCTAYTKGQRNTSCMVESGINALTEQRDRLKNTAQRAASAIQAENSRCKSFLSGAKKTGCSLEYARDVVVQHRDWSVQLAGQVQDGAVQRYTACSEGFRDAVLDTKTRVTAKMIQARGLLTDEYTSCQLYFSGHNVNTGCFLEIVQKETTNYKNLAVEKFQEVKVSLLEQQNMCMDFFAGQTGTGCALEMAREQMRSKAAELQAILIKEVGECKTYIVDGQNQTGCSLERIYNRLSDQHESTSNDPMEPISEVAPVEAVDSASIDADAGFVDESSQNELPVEATDNERKNRRKFAETYFDQLEPVPVEKLRMAANKSKPESSEDVEVRNTEESVTFEAGAEEVEVQNEVRPQESNVVVEDDPSFGKDGVSEGDMIVDEASESTNDVSDTAEPRHDEPDTPAEETLTAVEPPENAGETNLNENEALQTEEITTEPAQSESSKQDTGNMLDFVKLEYDEGGNPYLVKTSRAI